MSFEVLGRHFEELKKLPGVLNAGVATKWKDGKDTGIPSITVYVAEKKDCAVLLPEHCIPEQIEGVPTDVVELAPTTWEAGKTGISELHPEQKSRRMGVIKEPPRPKVMIVRDTATPSGHANWIASAQPIQDQMNCGCYDDKTEVLTKVGWKYWKDVTFNDEILCFDPTSKVLKYNHPTELFVYDYDGEMVQIKGAAIDLVVTPNHNIINYPWDESKKTISEKSVFTKADSLGWYFNLPCTGKWEGEEREFYHLNGQPIGPYYTKQGVAGSGFREGFDIRMDKWLDFLGVYIAEGYSTPQNHYEVGIAAVVEPKKTRVKELVESIPLHSFPGTDRFRINDKRLCLELMPLGQATDKYAPDYIKCLPPQEIRRFLDSFGVGDGQWAEDRVWRFWTSSKRLADDLQELIIKAGGWAQISSRPGRNSVLNGRHITANGPEYSLYMATRQHLCITRKDMVSRVLYKGKVYCAEVPTHAMMIRRNGKPLICGNSCTSFGSTGVGEIEIKLATGLVVKLSESSLFFCAGGTCANGAQVADVLNRFQSVGACPEDCLPYVDQDQACGQGICADWQKKVWKLKSWDTVVDDVQKAVLLDAGPLNGTFAVHRSFENYQSGVYQNLGAQDPIVGYHDVGIVGYDLAGDYYIIRNSWLDWGQNVIIDGVARPGYCMIKRSEMDAEMQHLVIDTGNAPIPTPVPPVPVPNPVPVPVPPPVTTYQLTLHTQGNGSVAVNPPVFTFNSGEYATLTATASTGYNFSGWSGGLTGRANPASLLMDSDKVVTATFVANSGCNPFAKVIGLFKRKK